MIASQKVNAAKSIELVVNKLKNSSFANKFTLTAKVNRSWLGQSKFEEKVARKLSCNITPSLTQKEEEEKQALVESIEKEFQADKDTFAILEGFSISSSLSVGDALPHYSEKLTDVFKSTPAEIKHESGEVILLDIWATWCGPCQGPMQHNQDMLEKNGERWGDKVKIIAISVDDDLKALQERIEAKKWNKIIHYTAGGWDNENKLLSNFELSGIPFVALVDKSGNLNFCGHPSEVNLETRIDELLSSDSVASSSANKSDLNKEGVKKLKNAIGKELKEFVEQQKDGFDIKYDISLQKIVTIQGDKQSTVYNTPTFSSEVRKKQISNYTILKKKVESSLGEEIKLKKTSEKILDVQKTIQNDIKSIAEIYSKEGFKAGDFEHVVNLKFSFQEEKKFKSDREDHVLQVQKLLIEPTEEQKEKVERATDNQREFIIKKYRSGDYTEYLFKLHRNGIQTAEKAEDLFPLPVKVSEEIYRKAKELFDDKSFLQEEFRGDLQYNPRLKISIKRHRVFNSEGKMKDKFYEQPLIKYEIKDDDSAKFKEQILDKIINRIGKETFIVKERRIPTVSIPEGQSCKLCNANLVLPYYYNPFQKEHYCIDCGNKKDESKKTIEAFNVPHNLVYVTSNDVAYLNGIETHKIGKDAQPEATKEIQNEYSFSCNGCSKGSQIGRYICLNCRPGRVQGPGYLDLCPDCFEKATIQKDKELLDKLLEEEKHNQNHLFLKVITSEGGYRNF